MHWVVDGNNVMGSRPDGWWRDRVGAALRLHGRLVAFAEDRGDPVTLVLDGAPNERLPEGERDAIDVRYATRGGRDAADDRIVELVDELRAGGVADVRVVTSDRGLVTRVERLGATVVRSGPFLGRLDRLDEG